jgi:hypothetical protein
MGRKENLKIQQRWIGLLWKRNENLNLSYSGDKKRNSRPSAPRGLLALFLFYSLKSKENIPPSPLVTWKRAGRDVDHVLQTSGLVSRGALWCDAYQAQGKPNAQESRQDEAGRGGGEDEEEVPSRFFLVYKTLNAPVTHSLKGKI